MTKKQIEKISEKLGWDCIFNEYAKNDKHINLTKHSPEGQELLLDERYNSLEEIPHLIKEAWCNYDPSYEAYIWLDSNGHGKNGAPHDMGKVYNDMVWCESEIETLADAFEKGNVTIATIGTENV